MVLKTGCFLFAIVFGTHFIRTWSFNRHEAITFECSSTTFLISILVIVRFGYSEDIILIAVGLFVAFFLNAFSQWHYYMVLQDIIEKAFATRSKCLKNRKDTYYINNILQSMASVAIMPSFSRFIEELKLFNNPGNLIGLIKSIMKRQRFQKKKYHMRECFAENANMIGPCKPTIDKMVYDQANIVSGAIHPNDLALGYSDEKKALFLYDFLGFGGLIVLWYYLSVNIESLNTVLRTGSFCESAIVVLAILVFTYICHILRHFGFARYESFSYELSCTSLISAAFFVFMEIMAYGGRHEGDSAVLALLVLLFLTASFINRRTDKVLHREINKTIDKIIYRIPPDSETNRTKRRFLNNLKFISEWCVVPFPGVEKRLNLSKVIMFTPKLKLFYMISQKKKDIPGLMEELVDRVVPEYKKHVSSADFRVPAKKLIFTKRVLNSIGIIGVIIVCVSIYTGVF